MHFARINFLTDKWHHLQVGNQKQMNVRLISGHICFYVICSRAFCFVCVCFFIVWFYRMPCRLMKVQQELRACSFSGRYFMKVCSFLDSYLIHGKEVAFWLFSAQAEPVPPFLFLLLCSRLLFCAHEQISISINAGMCWWSDRWQRFVCSCWKVRGVYVQKAELQPNGGGRVWVPPPPLLVKHIQNGLLLFFWLYCSLCEHV